MILIPEGSIYFWMYEQGLKHIDLEKIISACHHVGKNVRGKDVENYWNGYHRSDLYHSDAAEDIFMLTRTKRETSASGNFFDIRYSEYPTHPYVGMPEIQNRWIPCNKANKPMIKWGNGCMVMADAVAYTNQVYLAENVKGCQFIVVDCDGDHDKENLDMETVRFLGQFRSMTHCLTKPTDDGVPLSFHLTFSVDRIIPTMHFPYAHIDIVGNRRNSLRYWKNKKWNGIAPAKMTDDIWSLLQEYIKHRKEIADGFEFA